ncbi:MAG: adenine phosphoribosyltransferase [Clostridiales bacterium]|nr:adenine phosphoribosyltransferase [Clostridiales bacterium]
MNKDTYTLHIAGLERRLQKFPVSPTLDIAAFILFGDVELTVRCAEELIKKCPEFDYIATPEAKSIPLAYEMSKQSGKKYIILRKGVKVYMDHPEKVVLSSITTQNEQALYLGHEDGDLLKDKRILLVDDVISTGESLAAAKKLIEEFGGNVIASAAPLAEGAAADRKDIIFLEKLPLFFK